jgi:hypothetical protein
MARARAASEELWMAVWSRTHYVRPAVTFTASASLPEAHHIVSAAAWDLPGHFDRTYKTFEEARRAADEVLASYVPHDCAHCGCTEWRFVRLEFAPEGAIH